MKKVSKTELAREEWDLLGDDHEAEWWPMIVYEYARESATIRGAIDDGLPCPSLPNNLSYVAELDGALVRVPNLLRFPWHHGPSFSSTPWLILPKSYRATVTKEMTDLFTGIPSVSFADTQFMAPHIISRGNDRSGIDTKAGRERLAIEVDWAGSDDEELTAAFKKWLKNARPKRPNVGNSIKRKPRYAPRIRALATSRILAHYGGPGSIPQDTHVWQWIQKNWPSKNDPYRNPQELSLSNAAREMQKVRKEARCYLRELFPFLPDSDISSAFVGRKHDTAFSP